MVRILKHAKASEMVIALARTFSCPVCEGRRLPKAVRPTKVPSKLAPLRLVELDVKELPGWRDGMKVKALNVVCPSSGLQQMMPFFVQESGSVLKELFERGWCQPYGAPALLKCDAGKTNLGQEIIDAFEKQGMEVTDAAGEAHEQVGHAERHGTWFEDILIKVLDQVSPKDEAG